MSKPHQEHRPAAPAGTWFLQAVVLALLVGWVYWPALRGAWLWDDVTEISGNRMIQDPAGLHRIWFDPPGPDYFPLKSTVEWLLWRTWGDQPLGYHAVSIGLHLLSALLLWRVLGKLGIRCAWLGGLLFAVHPLAVESVAWVAELKNTLSLPLLLLALGAYLDYDERGGWGDYLCAAALFLAAMLCKTSVAMFPVVLLLHAWWKRGHVTGKHLAASAVFFAISVALGLVTVWFQQHRAIGAAVMPGVGWPARLAVAGQAVGFYLYHAVLPLQQLPIYPRWTVDPPTLLQFLPWPVLAGLLGWFWVKRGTWGRHALFGAGCFLAGLLPVLGFIPMSYSSISWVADHFAYLPLTALAGLAAAGAGTILGRLPPAARAYALGGAGLVVAVLAMQSRVYAGNFRSEEVFWGYAVEHNPQAWMAYNNLGSAVLRAGRPAEALPDFESALRLKPDYPEALNNRGSALAALGRWPEAAACYEGALRLNSNYADAHVDLANALFQLNRFTEAVGHYEAGLRLRPDYPEAHNNLGTALIQLGRTADAAAAYAAEVRLRPDYAEARNNLGNALARLDRLPEAVEQYEAAVRLRPDLAEAHGNLGAALLRLSRWEEARVQLLQTLRLRPDDARALENLARLDALQPAPGARR